MDENEVREALQMFQSANPKKTYEIEEYDYIPPEGKGMGRDPDLH